MSITKMPKNSPIGLVLFFITLAFLAPAQEKPGNYFRLDQSDLVEKPDSANNDVMAASRTLKKIGDLPVTVYVITRDEILGNGYTTLVEAIGSLPGVRVSQPGSATDGETFQIRGIYGNYYCKVMVDGISVKPSAVGGMPVGAQLPVRQAERIEVIFGPASSVYGADALAGVINIVTHKSDRPVTAQADIALGSNGYEYLNVTIGGKLGRNKNVFTYSLFGNTSNQKDLRVKYDRDFLYNPGLYDSSYSFLGQPYFSGDSSSIAMDRMPMASRMLGFSMRWRGLAAQVVSMSRLAFSSIGRDPSVFSYNNPGNFWREELYTINLSYTKDWKKVSSATTVSWLIYRADNQSNFGMVFPVGETGKAFKYAASDDLAFEEQLTFVPLKGLEIVTGLQYQYSGNLPMTNDLAVPFPVDEYHAFSRKDIPDTSIFQGFGLNPVTFHKAGAYAQFLYQTGRFTLIGGYRLDYHSWFDFAHSPKIAVQYMTERSFSVRASFGTGYSVPATYYMYSSTAYRDGQGIYYAIVPNTGLEPEKLIAAEAGVRWNRLSWFDLDASVFWHRIFEQFSRSFVALDSARYPLNTNPLSLSSAYVNDNNSLAELLGIQANFGFKNIWPAIGLRADLDLTLSKGREVLPSGLGTIDDYRQVPAFLGQLNISLHPLERVHLQLRNTLSSGWVRGYLPLNPDLLRQIGYPVDIDGYYTLDVIARFLISRNFEAFAHFNNVTNARYAGLDAYSDEYDLFYNPQQGFNMRFGLNFRME